MKYEIQWPYFKDIKCKQAVTVGLIIQVNYTVVFRPKSTNNPTGLFY